MSGVNSVGFGGSNVRGGDESALYYASVELKGYLELATMRAEKRLAWAKAYKSTFKISDDLIEKVGVNASEEYQKNLLIKKIRAQLNKIPEPRNAAAVVAQVKNVLSLFKTELFTTFGNEKKINLLVSLIGHPDKRTDDLNLSWLIDMKDQFKSTTVSDLSFNLISNFSKIPHPSPLVHAFEVSFLGITVYAHGRSGPDNPRLYGVTFSQKEVISMFEKDFLRFDASWNSYGHLRNPVCERIKDALASDPSYKILYGSHEHLTRDFVMTNQWKSFFKSSDDANFKSAAEGISKVLHFTSISLWLENNPITHAKAREVCLDGCDEINEEEVLMLNFITLHSPSPPKNLPHKKLDIKHVNIFMKWFHCFDKGDLSIFVDVECDERINERIPSNNTPLEDLHKFFECSKGVGIFPCESLTLAIHELFDYIKSHDVDCAVTNLPLLLYLINRKKFTNIKSQASYVNNLLIEFNKFIDGLSPEKKNTIYRACLDNFKQPYHASVESLHSYAREQLSKIEHEQLRSDLRVLGEEVKNLKESVDAAELAARNAEAEAKAAITALNDLKKHVRESKLDMEQTESPYKRSRNLDPNDPSYIGTV